MDRENDIGESFGRGVAGEAVNSEGLKVQRNAEKRHQGSRQPLGTVPASPSSYTAEITLDT
jgi:hypothetical protein